MASFESAKSITLIAGSDFTGDLYKVVEITADNTCDIVGALTDTVVGIVGEEVLSGGNVPIVLLQGRVKVRAGAAITVGQVVIPATDGEVTGATQATLGDGVMGLGVALQAADNAGDIIEILAQPIFRSNDAA
jgi:hypothetical protein